MFNIDISDSSIEALQIKKGLLGKIQVSSFGRVELEEGVVKNGEILNNQKLAEKIGEVVKKGKVNFTLPDLRTFTHRVLLPADISRSAIESFLKEKVVEIIPDDLENLIYDFKVVNETERGQEVLFIAISKKILTGYLKTFEILKLTPLSAVPESMAAFEIFKDTVVKDEIILYVDIGSKISSLSLFDKFGPFLTLNEPVETRVLQKEVKKAISFAKEKYEKEIKRVILGGGGSLEIDGEAFSKEIGIWTTKADKILADKLSKISLIFKTDKPSPVLFLNAIGLSLLSQRREELNLLKDTKDWLTKLIQEKKKEKEVEAKEKEKKGEGGKGVDEEERKGEEKEGKEKPAEKPEEPKEDKRPAFSKFFGNVLRLKRPLIIIIVALLTFLLLYLFVKRPWTGKVKKEIPAASPTIQPTIITPAPITKLDRRDLKIKVLNGSGVPGRAGEVASTLENLGYKVVATGNADSFDYEEMIIKIKEEKRDFLSLLTNDLKSLYTVSSEEVILLEDEEAEAVVIIGKKQVKGGEKTE